MPKFVPPEDGIITKEYRSQFTSEEIQQYINELFAEFDKHDPLEKFFESQVMYLLEEYDPKDEYYEERCWLKDPITPTGLKNLVAYNKQNVQLFNSLMEDYRAVYGKFPRSKDWPGYMEARTAVASGKPKKEIYLALVKCFGQEAVDKYIDPNK